MCIRDRFCVGLHDSLPTVYSYCLCSKCPLFLSSFSWRNSSALTEAIMSAIHIICFLPHAFYHCRVCDPQYRLDQSSWATSSMMTKTSFCSETFWYFFCSVTSLSLPKINVSYCLQLRNSDMSMTLGYNRHLYFEQFWYINTKFELMLTRRAKAYSSSCTVVYLKTGVFTLS